MSVEPNDPSKFSVRRQEQEPKSSIEQAREMFASFDGAGNSLYSSKDTVITPEEVKAGVEALLSGVKPDYKTAVIKQIAFHNMDEKALSEEVSKQDLSVSPASIKQYKESVLAAYKESAPKEQLSAEQVNEIIPMVRDGYLTSSPEVKKQAAAKLEKLGNKPENAVKFVQEEFGLNVAPAEANKIVQAMRAGATSKTQAEAIKKQDDAQASLGMQKNLADDDKKKKEEKSGLRADKAEEKENFLMTLVKMVLSAFGINFGSEEGQHAAAGAKSQLVGQAASASTVVEKTKQSAENVTGEKFDKVDKFSGISREALEAAMNAGEGARNAGTRSSNEQYQYAGAAQPQQQTASAGRF